MDRNKAIGTIASEIMVSYEKNLCKETRYPDYLPDKDEVTQIIALLRKLLFPGYFNGSSSANVEDEVREATAAVEEKLQRQVCRAFNSSSGKRNDCADINDGVCAVCLDFLNRLPNLLDLLMTDVQAAYDGDPAASNKHEIIFAYPGVYAISIYRMAHELHSLSVPLIPRMMTEHAHSMTGIDIHPGATIGRYFFIDHGTGVVIGETTEIGAHVKLYQGVTLGGLSTRGGQKLKGKKRHPTLEDDVTVYSGATILGGETVIGKGSVVGGNVFITQSVPPYTRINMKPHELEYKYMQ